jgi:CheY-like chemotaxis protein
MATILLVGGDPFWALRCKSVLERRFPDVKQVGDAGEALCLVEEREFADNLGLVIAYHNMPGIGGPAFVSELLNRMQDLPVLVLGGATGTQDDYVAIGACFRPRSISGDELLTLADQMLSRICEGPERGLSERPSPAIHGLTFSLGA